MLRRLLLIFSAAVLITSLYLVHQVDGQSPWGTPPNCTTYRCSSNSAYGLTLEECTKKHGADRVLFFPTGGYCNCSVCMKNLKKGEDCSDLLIQDRPSYVRCGANLSCSSSSRTCE